MESLSLAYKLLIVGWLVVLIWVPYVIYTNKKIHPKALFVLFFAELWERFSYYGMRALLVLYMIDVGAELSYEKSQAYAIYGAYGAMVYATPLLGGLIAEKFFGYRNSILWGGILMALGHFTMAFPLISELGIGSPESIHALSEPMFFIALGLLILGNGFFKPNISSFVGTFYKENSELRDRGFNLFYMGINIGAFLGALTVGAVAAKYGWHYGFGLAGIGMAIGQLVYFYGLQYLEGVGEFIGSDKSPDKELMNKPLTKVEKDRMLVMFLSFLIIIVFWGAFEQAGGLMSLYTEQKTDRMLSFSLPFIGNEVPAAIFQSINAFFIIIFATAVAYFWTKWANKGKESSSLFKMAVGLIIMAFGFFFMSKASTEVEVVESWVKWEPDEIVQKSAMIWLVLAYLFHTIGELCASPVALSFITKLAPVKYAAFMMGAYFAATGLGNKVAGFVGQLSEGAGEFQVFTGIAIFCTLFGILVLLLLKPLKRLTHGAEEKNVEIAQSAKLKNE